MGRIAFWFLLIAAPLMALDPDTPLPISPHIVLGELKNGVHYYIRERKEIGEEELADGRASLRLVVPVGSVLEGKGEEGVAHFVEHMLFRGTRQFSRDDLSNFLHKIGASIGADVNAHTGFDETVYEFEVPLGDPDNLPTALKIMADWLSAAKFDARDVEEERKVIIEEWRRGLGVNLRLMESAVEALVEGSPYADHLPIGFEKTIRKVSSGTIRRFYRRWYRSAPVGLVVVGAVNPTQVEELIHTSFGSLPRRPVELPKREIPRHEGVHFALTSDPETTDISVALLFKEERKSIRTAGDLRGMLLRNLFHQLLTARLREVAEDEGSPFFQLESSEIPLVAPLNVHMLRGTCDGESVPVALGQLALELRRIQLGGFTQSEFERAIVEERKVLKRTRSKGRRRSNRVFAEDCVSHFLSETPLCGTDFTMMVWEELINTATAEEVASVASGWSLLDDCTVHVAIPDAPDIPPLVEDELAELLTLAWESEISPYVDRGAGGALFEHLPRPGEITEVTAFKHPDLTEFTLENGMVVRLMPTHSDDETVLLSGVALGGLSDRSFEEMASAQLASDLLNESGIGGHSPSQVTKLLAGQQAGVIRYIGPYFREIFGSADREDLEALFQLVHLTFVHQVNDPGVFNSLQTQLELSMKLEERNPHDAFFQKVSGFNSGQHPYYTFPTPQDIEWANFESANQFGIAAFSNPADFVFNIVGNWNEREIRELVQRYLASIPQRGERASHFSPFEVDFPEGITKEILCKGMAPQSLVQITFPISLEKATPEQFELLDVARRVIGSQVHNVLREKLSATYHVDARVEFLYPEIDRGYLSLQFACDPEDAELLGQVALRELRQLKARGPLEDEVDQLVHQKWRRLAHQVRENDFWIVEMQKASLFDWGHDSLATVRQRLDSVTQPALAEQIGKMLSMDHYSMVILYPVEDSFGELKNF